MNATATATNETPTGAPGGLLSALGSLLLALLVGGAWGLVTARVQFVYAPWLLFPLGGGLILGGVLVLLQRAVGIPNTRRGAMGVALIACLVAVPAQHIFCYRHDVAEQLRNPTSESDLLARAAVPELKRDTFRRYMESEASLGRQLPFGIVARHGAAWASHTLDAALVVAAALLITARLSPKPTDKIPEQTTA